MTLKLKILYVLFLLMVFMTAKIFAEVKSIGTPSVRNYDNSVIQAGTQTWMIDMGANGLAYFANNEGVLEFDGIKWCNYPLPGKTVVRSVKTTHDGRIYAGGYNEFGFFQANQSGQLCFNPLHDLLPEKYSDFGEVWKIYEMSHGIVFQSFTQIMIFHNETFHVIAAPDMFHFSFLIDHTLYINDQTYGLYMLSADSLVKLTGTEILAGKLIWGMLPRGGDILIATAGDGIFRYDGITLQNWVNPASDLLKEVQVFCAMPVNENTYAFGSIQDGLIICDTAGNIIQHINIDKGLQNNTILSLQMDQCSNLWLGLDNGIDYVEINSPLTFFSTYNNLSSGYAAVIHDGLLYLGTNQGVFYHDWVSLAKETDEQKFRLIPGTQGQVWSLQVIEGTLFCGHNSGIFIIEGTRAEMMSGVQGGWTFIQPEGQNDVVICGTYTYLVKFERIQGQWSKGIQVKGFKESSRYLANAGPQSIWISHGYKGVYRLHFNQTYDSIVRVAFYDSGHGFPSDKDISVFEVSNRIVFTTGKGVYRYNQESDNFIPDEMVLNRLSRSDMNIVREDKQGNIWYFTSEEAGVYRLQEDGNYAEVQIPFRKLKGKFIKWFQFVYPYDETNVIIGTQTGFAHYTPVYNKDYQMPFKALVRNMQILSGIDSVLYYGSPSSSDFFTELPYKFNHLQFEFAANDFANPDRILYLTMLEGFDQEWVVWHSRTIRQFTNLRHGDYIFKVKAINIYGAESETAVIAFKINPPWYLNQYAFIAYVIVCMLIIVLISKYIRYRIDLSRKEVEEKHLHLSVERERQLQIESLLAEQELIRLRNEKLRSEKIQKDKELANTTMQIIQKSKSLAGIKHDLRKLFRELGKHPAVYQLSSIIRKIDRNMDTEKQWEVFEKHFESVHEEFLKRLKENYPDLSPRELKLCAYLRLNISSKEIATLMNISVRGVEISRYRLRKKLKLDHDINLTDFIISY
ncbi:MAG: triple tyrosine motif-containing protein [Bacteroidales bacterium]